MDQRIYVVKQSHIPGITPEVLCIITHHGRYQPGDFSKPQFVWISLFDPKNEKISPVWLRWPMVTLTESEGTVAVPNETINPTLERIPVFALKKWVTMGKNGLPMGTLGIASCRTNAAQSKELSVFTPIDLMSAYLNTDTETYLSADTLDWVGIVDPWALFGRFTGGPERTLING